MYFTKPLAVRLALWAKEHGGPLEQSYRNTFHCNALLSQQDGTMRGTYCGNRWCLTCARIRSALAINKYLPVLESWGDRWFVTLTLRNVPEAELAATLDTLQRGVLNVCRSIKRTDKLRVVALRKLEITYNERTAEYHPHYHLVVQGQASARRMVQRWLEMFPERTDPRAQDVRPAHDAGTLLELFKYFTKLVSKRRMIPTHALDAIFRVFRGRRAFQPVGFILPKDADPEGELAPDVGTPAVSRPSESIAWQWRQSATDWVDDETGECLTGYDPSDSFRRLVEQPLTTTPEPSPALMGRGRQPSARTAPPATMPEHTRRLLYANAQATVPRRE